MIYKEPISITMTSNQTGEPIQCSDCCNEHILPGQNYMVSADGEPVCRECGIYRLTVYIQDLVSTENPTEAP